MIAPRSALTAMVSRRIRGVFIGIDRYQSPDINELRYAQRDARALHTLQLERTGVVQSQYATHLRFRVLK